MCKFISFDSTVTRKLAEPYGCSRCYCNGNNAYAAIAGYGCASDDECDDSDGGRRRSCKFCRRRNRRVRRRLDGDNIDIDIDGDGDDFFDDGEDFDDLGAQGDDGVGISDCCEVNALKITQLGDRLDRFKRELEIDIDLIFSRLDDRIDDLQSRMARVKRNYGFIVRDVVEINTEISEVRTEVTQLDRLVGNQAQIQLEVILGLGESIRTRGLMIGNRWRLSSSGNGRSFFISDVLANGYYRFRTTRQVRDVATLPT